MAQWVDDLPAPGLDSWTDGWAARQLHSLMVAGGTAIVQWLDSSLVYSSTALQLGGSMAEQLIC